MPGRPAPSELDEVRGLLAARFGEVLDDTDVLDEAAEIERLVAMTVIPLADPELPPELSDALVQALAARGERAAGVLAGVELLAPAAVAQEAGEALKRLRAGGRPMRVPGNLGALRVREGFRLRCPTADMYLLVLARPGDARLQVASLVVECEQTEGALVAGMLSGPQSEEEARELLALEPSAADEPLEREPVGPREAREIVVAAAARAHELDIEVDFELVCWLPLLSLALTGDARALPPLRAGVPEPSDLYVDPEDEEAFDRITQAMLEDYDAEMLSREDEDSPLWRSGHFIAGSLLEWKWGCGDGRLAHWTVADVEEYLLDHVPRKLSASEEVLEDTADCVTAWLRFLDDAGVLEGDDIEALAETATTLRDQFVAAAQDRSRWGLAKSMAMQAHSEGIDLTQPGALEAWMDDFNGRPPEERNQIIGPPMDRMVAAAGLEPRPARTTASGGNQAKQAKRKATRAARKRNRR